MAWLNFFQPDGGERVEIIWEALRREAGLAAEHLGIGATAIGRADSERTATYAQAFFALSVGFERAAMMALTLDAALSDDGAFLDGAALRQLGHGLDGLMDAVEDRATERGVAEAQRLTDPIHQAILAALPSRTPRAWCTEVSLRRAVVEGRGQTSPGR